MATNPMRLSADDVFDVEVPDHLLGYELVDGELVEVSAPGALHGRIASRLSHLLLSHIEAHATGGDVYVETGYVLGLRRDPERLRVPDVTYVSEATLQARGGAVPLRWFRLIADLVIEIDSPGQRPARERTRINEYLEAGVRLIWVVHTTPRSATMHRADGSIQRVGAEGVLEGDPVLPGLRVPLARLYPEP